MRENVPTAVVKLCVSTGRCRRFFWYLQRLAGEERPSYPGDLPGKHLSANVRIEPAGLIFQRENKVNIARRGVLTR